MTLREAQSRFAKNICYLILFIYGRGYEVTLGDVYRDPRVHGEQGEKKSYSSAKSAHKQRLAVDLNLFKHGIFLSSTKDHEEFGRFWKRLDPENRWGGDFSNPDGNHYSYEYGGIQ